MKRTDASDVHSRPQNQPFTPLREFCGEWNKL